MSGGRRYLTGCKGGQYVPCNAQFNEKNVPFVAPFKVGYLGLEGRGSLDYG